MNAKRFLQTAVLSSTILAASAVTPLLPASAVTTFAAPAGTCGSVDREMLDAPTVFRYGLSGKELQDAFFGDNKVDGDGSYHDAGFHPLRITGYVDNGEQKFATKWAQFSGPGRTSRFGLTGDEFHDRYLELSADYRLVDVSGYNTPGGDVRYADVWVKNTDGFGWAVTRDVAAADMAGVKASMKSKGYAPTRVEGYTLDGSTHFIASWIKVPARCNWQMEEQMTGAQYQALATTNVGKLRLVHVDSYLEKQGTAVRFAAIWLDETGPALRAVHGNHWYTFQRQLNSNRCDGYVIDSFYGMEGPDGWNTFGAVWSFNAKPVIGPSASLTARVAEQVDCSEARGGAALINLTTGETAFAHADQRFGTASAIKSTILYSLLRKADAEGINLDTKTMKMTQTYYTDNNSGSSDLKLNKSYTLAYLAQVMIQYSDNGATNALIDFVGADAINDELDALGLSVTTLNRYMSGNTSPSLHGLGSWGDDYRAGFDNFSTPRELATFYSKVWTNDGLLSAASHQRFLDVLALANTLANDLLPAGFDPDSALYYNKPGGMTYTGLVGDYAHIPQVGAHENTTEGGIMQFTKSGEVVVYAVLLDEKDPGASAKAIACIGYEAAVEFSNADAGPPPATCW